MNPHWSRMRLPELIIISSVAIVILSMVLFYAIDVRNVWGMRDSMFNANPAPYYFPYRPFFFHHYGRNTGLAEIIQYSLLSVTVGICFYQAGVNKAHGVIRTFYMLFGMSMLWMLIEDAADIRQTLMSYVQVFARENDQGVFGTLFEGVYFISIAMLPLVAVFQARTVLSKAPRALMYLLCGLGFRYLAGGLSFIGTAFDLLLDKNLYTQLGEQLMNLAFRFGDSELQPLWETWNQSNWDFQISFFLLDSLIEENIEILGNAFLIAGILCLIVKIPQPNLNPTKSKVVR